MDEERGRYLMSAAQVPTGPKLQIVVCDEERDLFCVDGRCGAVERGCEPVMEDAVLSTEGTNRPRWRWRSVVVGVGSKITGRRGRVSVPRFPM